MDPRKSISGKVFNKENKGRKFVMTLNDDKKRSIRINKRGRKTEIIKHIIVEKNTIFTYPPSVTEIRLTPSMSYVDFKTHSPLHIYDSESITHDRDSLIIGYVCSVEVPDDAEVYGPLCDKGYFCTKLKVKAMHLSYSEHCIPMLLRVSPFFWTGSTEKQRNDKFLCMKAVQCDAINIEKVNRSKRTCKYLTLFSSSCRSEGVSKGYYEIIMEKSARCNLNQGVYGYVLLKDPRLVKIALYLANQGILYSMNRTKFRKFLVDFIKQKPDIYRYLGETVIRHIPTNRKRTLYAKLTNNDINPNDLYPLKYNYNTNRTTYYASYARTLTKSPRSLKKLDMKYFIKNSATLLHILTFIPRELHTVENIIGILNVNFNCIIDADLRLFKDALSTRKGTIDLLKQCGNLLMLVDKPDYEMCMIAIQHNPLAIRFVDLPSDEMYRIVIKRNPSTFIFVKPEYQTMELCRFAFEQDPRLVILFNEEFQDIILFENMNKKAIKNATINYEDKITTSRMKKVSASY